MQSERREIAIWDRGELQDVRDILFELGVEFSQGPDKDSREVPTHLLISSGSDCVTAIRQIRASRCPTHFLHLVVIEGSSRSLVTTLEREGCDMIVPAPIHPTALRLIVQRALFSGAERRRLPRVAIGARIKLKKGLWSRGATLAELSARGCGVDTHERLKLRDEVSLLFPAALSGVRPLRLEGRVVGVDEASRTPSQESSAAIVFQELTKERADTIASIMRRSGVGPTGQLDHEPGAPVVATTVAKTTETSERRSGSRRRYEHAILARGEGQIHSLIGCNLSLGGMRVAQDSGLEIGSRLRLAIYGVRGTEPVVVSAVVVRQDADTGIGLEFDPLEPAAAARLQTIVDSLPKLSESETPTLVSEVLEETRPAGGS